jgi:hypothetical protein
MKRKRDAYDRRLFFVVEALSHVIPRQAMPTARHRSAGEKETPRYTWGDSEGSL